MCYTMSLILMAAIIVVGLTINPIIGLALLISAGLAVACTYGRQSHPSSDGSQHLLSHEDQGNTYELNDYVGFYEMDDCACGNRKMASSSQCYGCSQRKG